MESLANNSLLKGNDKRYKSIIWVICIVYTLSSICKGVYASSLIDVVNSLQITKAEAGLAITSYYLTYAVGQIVFGRLARWGNLAYKIGFSLMLTAVLMVLIVVSKTLLLMIIIFGIMGFTQAIVWPTVVELQSIYMPNKMIESGAVIISSGLAFASVICYVISSISVYMGSWTYGFYFLAFLALICGVFVVTIFNKYLSGTQTHEKIKTKATNKAVNGATKAVLIVLIFEILFIVITSYVRGSMTNWLPSMISDVFGVASYFSIIMTIIVAFVSVFGAILVKFLHKFTDNYMAMLGISMTIALISLIFLRLFYDCNMYLSVVLASIVVMMASCINVLLVSVIPLKMRDVVDSGRFSATANAFASVAAAFTTTISGAIIDSNGGNSWALFYNVIIIFSAVYVLASLVATIYWKKKMVKLIQENEQAD